jgi:hypothetical protein
MEDPLELRCPTLDAAPCDLAFGAQTPSRVFKYLTIKSGLDAVSGGVPNDRVQVDRSANSVKLEPGRSLVDGQHVSEQRECVERTVDRIGRQTQVQISVGASLLAQEGIDTPTASDPNAHAGAIKGIEYGKDF